MERNEIRGDAGRPRLRVFGSARLRDLVHSVAPDYAVRTDIRVVEKLFDDAVAEARALHAAGDGDVFVSAGANGAWLRERLDAPVVILKVSGSDVLQALARARGVSRRVALVTHQETMPALEAFAREFGLQIEQRAYTTTEDAELCVRDLALNDFEVVVGSSAVCDMAALRGMTGVFLYSADSVRRALDDALEIARIARAEEARRQRLDTLIRHLAEGVLAVDEAERVQTLNPAMERLLGVQAGRALGMRLSELAPELSLARTLQGGETEVETIERVGPRTLVVNRIPLVEHGRRAGAALTCQDAGSIQRADRNLRVRHRARHLAARHELAAMLGESVPMQRLRALAGRYARTDATVLVTGESGTGKELLAQGLHNASGRRDGPFVAINCAALPETLLESELFGYEEGAFTGSRRGGKPGLFELAHTGTIFLDEVGDVPMPLQTRLLRVLQEKEVLHLGGADPIPVDVRVLAATNRDLKTLVAEGRFREDLYYRLNILRLHLPPLRERPGDLPLVAESLLRDALRRHGAADALPALLRQVVPLLERHAWPGNVRELENVLERIAVLAIDARPSRPLPLERLREAVPELFAAGTPPAAPGSGLRTLAREAEARHIRQVLEECGGNQAEAARRLGIGRTTLWRRLNGGPR